MYIKRYCSSKWIWGTVTCTCCYCNPSLIKETYFFDLQSICKKGFVVDFKFEWSHIVIFGSNLRGNGIVNNGQKGTFVWSRVGVSVYVKESPWGCVCGGVIIREEVGSVPPGAHMRRCSRRWRRGGRWWRRRRWPTRSTVSADSPRSCAGSTAPCWSRPRPPTGVPWSWAGALRTAAAVRSGARLHDPPLNSLRRKEETEKTESV